MVCAGRASGLQIAQHRTGLAVTRQTMAPTGFCEGRWRIYFSMLVRLAGVPDFAESIAASALASAATPLAAMTQPRRRCWLTCCKSARSAVISKNAKRSIHRWRRRIRGSPSGWGRCKRSPNRLSCLHLLDPIGHCPAAQACKITTLWPDCLVLSDRPELVAFGKRGAVQDDAVQ